MRVIQVWGRHNKRPPLNPPEPCYLCGLREADVLACPATVKRRDMALCDGCDRDWPEGSEPPCRP